MGDAAGIGPEIAVRAWTTGKLHEIASPFVIGSAAVFRKAAKILGVKIDVVEISSLLEAMEIVEAKSEEVVSSDIAREKKSGNDTHNRTVMPCLPIANSAVENIPLGIVNAEAGQAAYEAIVCATDLALENKTSDRKIDAIVTLPICKESLHLAGHKFPGHTELLADRCGVDDFAMMLYLPPSQFPNSPFGLGVVHTTLHIALRDVFESLTVKGIVEKCHLAHDAFRMLGANTPRIAVCALNPHAGEAGLFGEEEKVLIAPAVAAAKSDGLNVVGPLAVDALFPAAKRGEYDVVVAMYHDQGHIALKLLGMHSAVNITLGLPIVRTSVAHGTAFDIAGQGVAESSGLLAATQSAVLLANHRFN